MPRAAAAYGRLAAAALLCSCARGEAYFEVRQASNVPKAPLSIALLGAYVDGSMNAAVGADFARDLSRFLGSEPCGVGFNEQLETANPDGFAALQAEVTVRGVDQELLRMIAPAANGDLLLAVDMSGRLTTGELEQEPSPPSERSKSKVPASDPDPTAPHPGAGFGRHSAALAPRGTAHGAGTQPASDLDASASFYSVRLQRTVSLVSMRYTGSSFADGLQQLAEKLAALFPHSVCGTWSWEHVRVVHERDAAGLRLPLFHLERTDQPR